MTETRWYRDSVVSVMPDLMVFAKARTPNAHLAEDLVQETILRMFDLRRELRRDEVRPYAFTVLRNLFMDHYRRDARLDHDTYELFDKVEDSYDSDSLYELNRLIDTLRSFGKDCQEVLSLAGVGHTQREMSEVLDKPMGTIGSLLQRCRMKLVEVLGL